MCSMHDIECIALYLTLFFLQFISTLVHSFCFCPDVTCVLLFELILSPNAASLPDAVIDYCPDHLT